MPNPSIAANIGDLLGGALLVVCLGAFLALLVLGLFAKGGRAAKRARWRREIPEQDRLLPALAAERGWHYAPRDDQCLRIVDVLERGSNGESTSGDRHQSAGASGRGAYGLRFAVNPTAAAEHVITFRARGGEYVLFQHRWNQADHETYGPMWQEDRDRARFASTAARRLPAATPFVCVTRRWKGAVSGLVGHDTRVDRHRFDRDYLVFVEHQRFGLDIVHPRLTEWVMETEPPEGEFLVLWDGWCFITTEDILRAEEVDHRLERLDAFAGLIPDHVWNTDYDPGR
ncbi:hypothetical protein [Glycomyces xiaoerkulensis]|uniref:hypothetical protein n=1 Tax=Glycomyces xiaoerkulensis TaxID=2038139 RepID=UPI000C267CAA|nr:hypothetical protein [Glycomyces xiaoerkulensis]